MFVTEQYSVPSAGDWSVLSRGTVELDGVKAIELRGCTWAQNGVYINDRILMCAPELDWPSSGRWRRWQRAEPQWLGHGQHHLRR